MAAAISRIVIPPYWLENTQEGFDELSSATMRKVEKIIAQQIKYNFENQHPEVRTAELVSTPDSFKNGFLFNRTSVAYFMGKLVVVITAFYFYHMSKNAYLKKYEPVVQTIVGLYIGMSGYDLLSKIYRTMSISLQVVAYPPSMNIPLEQLANNTDEETGIYCDPYTHEPFSLDIKAPRHLLIGKYAFDLPAVLNVMLNKTSEDGIPSPLHHRTLTPEEKEKFIEDVSNFLSIDPEDLENCWKQEITDEMKDLHTQAILENPEFQEQLDQHITEAQTLPNQPVNVERIKEEFLADCLEVALNIRVRLEQQAYFLSLIPEISRIYFPEILESLTVPNS